MIKNLEILLIKSYQKITRPVYNFLNEKNLNPIRCRYTPSCSEYSIKAINKYGVFKGSVLSLKRINRCKYPYGGYDPLE